MFRWILLTGVIIVLLAAAGCGPSPEQQAAMTAAAWTATPPPTATPVPPTATFTPTPVPYDLSVSVVDAAGAPLPGVAIILPQSGSDTPQLTDADGRVSWAALPGAEIGLQASAQGYLPLEQAATLERGLSEITLTLARDPYGILPQEVCGPGESLLYLEDFQDGQTILKHYADGGAPVPLGQAADEPGNQVLVHDFSAPVGDYSTYLNQDETGKFFEFGDAAWRMRFMQTAETNWGLHWNTARPARIGEVDTSQSSYSIAFNTGRHIVVTRAIWDTNVQPVFTAGKPGLEDKALVIEPNVWHYLEVSTYQGRLQVWLDGKPVVDVVDDLPLPPGAFSIGRADSGIIYYDAISVCALSGPFASMLIPLPPTP